MASDSSEVKGVSKLQESFETSGPNRTADGLGTETKKRQNQRQPSVGPEYPEVISGYCEEYPKYRTGKEHPPYRSLMSHSKLLDPSGQLMVSEQKLKNVKITVNHLSAQLKVNSELKAILEDALKKCKEENVGLVKVNRGLITTVQQQNEHLKAHNVEPVIQSTLDLLEPVVDPVVIVNTIHNLRRKLADSNEKLRQYQFQERGDESDVLTQRVQELQYALEVLLEEKESRESQPENSSVDMYKRIIAELRRNIELQDKLNRGLAYKLRRSSEKIRSAPRVTRVLSKPDGDQPPYEEIVNDLKKRNAKLENRVRELEIELSRRSASSQEKDGESEGYIDDVDNGDNLLFEARSEELHYRLDASRLRVKTKELSLLLKSHEQKISELETANSRLTRERDAAQSRVMSRMMDNSTSNPTYSSGVLDIRGESLPYGASGSDSRYRGRQGSTGAQSSLNALARTPGIMSTNAGQRQHKSEPLQIRARGGVQPPGDRSQNYARAPAQKNLSLPPERSEPANYDCPNCSRRFPSSRVTEFQDHVDQCLG